MNTVASCEVYMVHAKWVIILGSVHDLRVWYSYGSCEVYMDCE